MNDAKFPWRPTCPEEIQNAILDHHRGDPSPRWLPIGSRSKPALSFARGVSGEKITPIDMTAWSGIDAYDPAEYTITVRSGTRIDQIQNVLAEHHQSLPFDPPRGELGSTIGGCVATGWSGPRRWRYGGIRDFILAVEMIDGLGRITRTGAPVVKNSAGFDVPKLMVGSAGRLGVITRVTLKVFPEMRAPTLLAIACVDADDALAVIQIASRAPWEPSALEWSPGGVLAPVPIARAVPMLAEQPLVFIELPGPESVAQSLCRDVQAAVAPRPVMTLHPDAAAAAMAVMRDFDAVGWVTVRVPVTPAIVPAWVARWAADGHWRVHFGLGGNVAWHCYDGLGPADSSGVATADDAVAGLSAWLDESARTGMVLDSPIRSGSFRIGRRWQDPVQSLVRVAIDPHDLFAI